MLTPHAHKDVFRDDVAQVPLRNGFGEALKDVGGTNERVVGLCADLTESTRMQAFAEAYPDRFVQIGIAEQNLAAVASGMASLGFRPFITSYAMFSPGRNWEQIRTTICYNDQGVVVVGSHAGVSVGPDGGTHQALEDIALMRVIPRMTVIAPCDTHEAYKATQILAGMHDAAYLRLAREKTPIMTHDETPFEIGKAYELWRSKHPHVTIVGCGPLLYNALRAAHELEEAGIGSVVINSHTIKPLDEGTIVALARETGAMVTVEEHQIAGGLGSAVAEVLVQHAPVAMRMVGVRDRFGQSGTPEELLVEYNLGVADIVSAVKDILK